MGNLISRNKKLGSTLPMGGKKLLRENKVIKDIYSLFSRILKPLWESLGWLISIMSTK